jgi:hypothetical protein
MRQGGTIDPGMQHLTERLAFPALAPRREDNVYRLKFQEESGRPAKDVEFEADGPYEALAVARREARILPVELWCNGRRLCSIKHHQDGMWEVWPT